MDTTNPVWAAAMQAAEQKRMLLATKGAVKPPPPPRTTDIELPNESGQIDPRLQPPQSLDAITAEINRLLGAKK